MSTKHLSIQRTTDWEIVLPWCANPEIAVPHWVPPTKKSHSRKWRDWFSAAYGLYVLSVQFKCGYFQKTVCRVQPYCCCSNSPCFEILSAIWRMFSVTRWGQKPRLLPFNSNKSCIVSKKYRISLLQTNTHHRRCGHTTVLLLHNYVKRPLHLISPLVTSSFIFYRVVFHIRAKRCVRKHRSVKNETESH